MKLITKLEISNFKNKNKNKTKQKDYIQRKGMCNAQVIKIT